MNSNRNLNTCAREFYGRMSGKFSFWADLTKVQRQVRKAHEAAQAARREYSPFDAVKIAQPRIVSLVVCKHIFQSEYDFIGKADWSAIQFIGAIDSAVAKVSQYGDWLDAQAVVRELRNDAKDWADDLRRMDEHDRIWDQQAKLDAELDAEWEAMDRLVSGNQTTLNKHLAVLGVKA